MSDNSTGFLTPNLGRRFIGALRSRGLRVQRSRVSDCIKRIDPIGTALRWRLVIRRRKYYVPALNSLWHIDSAHKLIKYKLVVHVFIDGKIRLLVYCVCCNNNKAETVLSLFERGVQLWDLPSRVRSDYGMENYLIGAYIIEDRGPNRGSIITWSSVHNSRVERSHRDIFSRVLVFYAQVFEDMEEIGILDPLNDIHLYCLHVSTPRINRSLEEFVVQMNNTPVSTKHNMYPLQMWEQRMFQNRNFQDNSLSESEIELYGVDPESVIQITDDDYQINITPPHFDISDDQYALLPDPMTEDLKRKRNLLKLC